MSLKSPVIVMARQRAVIRVRTVNSSIRFCLLLVYYFWTMDARRSLAWIVVGWIHHAFHFVLCTNSKVLQQEIMSHLSYRVKSTHPRIATRRKLRSISGSSERNLSSQYCPSQVRDWHSQALSTTILICAECRQISPNSWYRTGTVTNMPSQNSRWRSCPLVDQLLLV